MHVTEKERIHFLLMRLSAFKMKLGKIILAGISMLLPLLLTSCSDAENSDTSRKTEWEICRDWYNFDSTKIPLGIDTPVGIDDFVKDENNIKYISDGKILGIPSFNFNFWSVPSETMARHGGDCEDRALVGLALYYRRTGKKGSLLLGKYKGDGHAVANYCGEWYCSDFKKEREIPWNDLPSEIYHHRGNLGQPPASKE